MRDRSGQILRIACLALAALVLLQLVHAVFQLSQLAGVKIPSVPTLGTNTNATASLAPEPEAQSTNLPDATAKIKKPNSTNAEAAQIARGTNSTSPNSEAAHKTVGTNSVSTNSDVAQETGGTNSASTNSEATLEPGGANPVLTNFDPPQIAGETNSVSTNSEAAQIAGPTNSISTNAVAQIAVGTNSIATNSEAARIVGGTNSISTNVVAQTATSTNRVAGTNSVGPEATNSSRAHLPPSMAGMPGNAPKLSPEIQARVDKIVNSEIFAPVMHPLPMGLLGIAGDTAFLRTASGQTGMVKPGDSLGDLKLLQIGINRVLVEQNGQKKELTIFDGFGGDSLLTNQDETKK